MFYNKKICICGGGNLGHVLIAKMSQNGCVVNLLTNRPKQWSHKIEVIDCFDKKITGSINKISDNPEDVIPNSEIILLCLPGYMIEPTLKKIKPFLQKDQIIGSVVCSNGFFWIANHVLGSEIQLFGFQRVPFICRVKEYGCKAKIEGYKSLLKISGVNGVSLNEVADFLSMTLDTKTICLSHYLESALTNSNPLIHPARIYAMLSPYSLDIFDKEILFYEEWNDDSSEILIDCDKEFQEILSKLPINREEMPFVLPYYDSFDARSLTEKIRSIKSFKGIKMCMIKKDDGYVIDYTNRYFTEDIPYGLLIIKSFGELLNVPTPKIDNIIYWMQEKLNKEYLKNGKLVGANIKETGILQNFGIHSIEDL